jgi:sec-independent protein translocase protein TatB
MFGVDSNEFLLVMLVALVVIGPKDMPRALRVVGKWVAKARGIAAQFRSGFDEMIRESELADLEKKWKEENDRIMREHMSDDTQTAPVIEGPIAEVSAIEPAAKTDPAP